MIRAALRRESTSKAGGRVRPRYSDRRSPRGTRCRVWSCKDITVSWPRCRPGDIRLGVIRSPGTEIPRSRSGSPEPGQGSREHPAQEQEAENARRRKPRTPGLVGALRTPEARGGHWNPRTLEIYPFHSRTRRALRAVTRIARAFRCA